MLPASNSFRVKIDESVWYLKNEKYSKKLNFKRSKSIDSFYQANRTRYKLEKSSSVDSIEDNDTNSDTTDDQNSDIDTDSDDDLYQIEELDEINQFDFDPSKPKRQFISLE